MKDVITTEDGREVHHLVLAEEVTFFNKASIIQALEAIPSNSKVIIDCTHSKSIAYDVAEYVENYRRSAKLKNIAVQTVAFVPILKGMIEAGEIEIIGGNHNISMGEVIFYTNTLLINNPK
jgi:MFS superfamily sulfate permease-like transporter